MTLKPLWVVGGEDWPIQRPKRALNLPSKAVVVAVCREAVQLLLLVPQKIQEAEGLLSHCVWDSADVFGILQLALWGLGENVPSLCLYCCW